MAIQVARKLRHWDERGNVKKEGGKEQDHASVCLRTAPLAFSHLPHLLTHSVLTSRLPLYKTRSLQKPLYPHSVFPSASRRRPLNTLPLPSLSAKMQARIQAASSKRRQPPPLDTA